MIKPPYRDAQKCKQRRNSQLYVRALRRAPPIVEGPRELNVGGGSEFQFLQANKILSP